ncbi:hypothetical protein EDB85DRAFT_1887743 [Lactarius pseudohatsudake]|nr:hypothetical protein EDB85DRAFT_1887743 [Lactarius pseudohatsudake]
MPDRGRGGMLWIGISFDLALDFPPASPPSILPRLQLSIPTLSLSVPRLNPPTGSRVWHWAYRSRVTTNTATSAAMPVYRHIPIIRAYPYPFPDTCQTTRWLTSSRRTRISFAQVNGDLPFERKRKFTGVEDNARHAKRPNMDTNTGQTSPVYELNLPGPSGVTAPKTEPGDATDTTSELSKTKDNLRAALIENEGLRAQILDLQTRIEQVQDRLGDLQELADTLKRLTSFQRRSIPSVTSLSRREIVKTSLDSTYARDSHCVGPTCTGTHVAANTQSGRFHWLRHVGQPVAQTLSVSFTTPLSPVLTPPRPTTKEQEVFVVMNAKRHSVIIPGNNNKPSLSHTGDRFSPRPQQTQSRSRTKRETYLYQMKSLPMETEDDVAATGDPMAIVDGIPFVIYACHALLEGRQGTTSPSAVDRISRNFESHPFSNDGNMIYIKKEPPPLVPPKKVLSNGKTVSGKRKAVQSEDEVNETVSPSTNCDLSLHAYTVPNYTFRLFVPYLTADGADGLNKLENYCWARNEFQSECKGVEIGSHTLLIET